MKKIVFKIKGMHCASCEILLEKELAKIDGLKVDRVSHKTGEVELSYEEHLKTGEIAEAIEKCGYHLEEDEKKKS